ncbi:MAG: MurR/RpiR family transcriptional regulator [Bavariicoccus seileri]|uniref:MurR/RpiR family transcriptional regulator n=1 Tax=Bavariicoccus seileri TaxID=549685 RepID=UPI0003B5373D|nr:MurR/RpiR family transcriptional regulator [Bavariicoccus seileri]
MSFFGKLDFNELSEVDRSIYHYMSSNSDKIPFMRVRDIANESHTSASSVMRFIRKLGYSSFTEFRAEFKSESYGNNISKFDRRQLLDLNNYATDIKVRIRQIAEKIITCENIIFFGIGASGSVCEYAARRFASLGFNSFALTDPTFPLHSKLKNTSENVIVTLSVTGNTTELVEIINGFRNETDYTTVVITSNINSSLSSMSNYILSYNVEVRRLNHHEDMTSQIPCINLIEMLADEVYNVVGII